MSIPKEYIKMCKQSVEIQKQWKEHLWDLVYVDYHEKYIGTITSINRKFKKQRVDFEGIVCYITATGINNKTEWIVGKENLNWLPTQAQLQKMIFKKECIGQGSKLNTHHLALFSAVKDMKPYSYYDNFTSMEQLWLAFVMKEKYNKVWNGEDWEIE